jgi:hypothetical protein
MTMLGPSQAQRLWLLQHAVKIVGAEELVKDRRFLDAMVDRAWRASENGTLDDAKNAMAQEVMTLIYGPGGDAYDLVEAESLLRDLSLL